MGSPKKTTSKGNAPSEKDALKAKAQSEKQLEDELAQELFQEKNLLKALLENTPDYIYFKDKESRFIRTSNAHANAFNLDNPEEVVGKTDFDFFDEEHARAAFEDEQEVIRTGKAISIEEKEVWPNLTETWVLTTKMPLRDQNGEIIGTFGISKDITEKKIAELELEREKTFLETLINSSPVSIVVLDEKGIVIECNSAFEVLYGYSCDETLGQNIDTLITSPEHPEDKTSFTREVTHALERSVGKRKRKDGELVTAEIATVPVKLPNKTEGKLVIYHDITSLENARREAEEANRMKSEFLANMSHEIRTPMNGVIGMLELTLDTTLNNEQRDYLHISLQSAEALLALLNDILDLSKIEAKKLELETTDFHLRHLVEDVTFALAKKAEDKGLEIACFVSPHLKAELQGDPSRLRQILVNLIGNAIKFTSKGEITIYAEPVDETESCTTIRFSVKDTGIGIHPDRQAAVFERFTQADGSTTRQFGGSGLGLTISRQLVEAMKGDIGLESTPGVGSTFWFTVPFEKQLAPREAKESPPAYEALKGLHILAADDNATNRMILSKMLLSFGAQIETVANGQEAIKKLIAAQEENNPFKMILLDMQMPGMDGEQTIRTIKANQKTKDTMIIILTSLGQRGDGTQMKAIGCSGYLMKPIRQDVLREAIATVLNQEHANTTNTPLVTRHLISEKKRKASLILLAEDNPVNRKLAVVLLQKAGFSVDIAFNGLQAVDMVKKSKYAAVLMDVQMPEMDGFEATKSIRAWEKEGQHLPIIAMTAHALKGDMERCLQAGMDDYLSKPINSKKMIKTLDQWTTSQGR